MTTFLTFFFHLKIKQFSSFMRKPPSSWRELDSPEIAEHPKHWLSQYSWRADRLERDTSWWSFTARLELVNDWPMKLWSPSQFYISVVTLYFTLDEKKTFYKYVLPANLAFLVLVSGHEWACGLHFIIYNTYSSIIWNSLMSSQNVKREIISSSF